MNASNSAGTAMSGDIILVPEYLTVNTPGAINVPPFLSGRIEGGAIPACDFCIEVACETDAMTCGQCSGQSCTGQCSSAQCGQCGSCQKTCQLSCQHSCQSACQDSCQNCQSCQSSCEKATQYPTSSGHISVSATSATSITLRLSSISKATYYVVAYRPSGTSVASTKRTTSLSVTITGLEPNTEYVFNYYGGNDYGTGPYMPSGVYAKTKPLIVVAPWSWDASNGSASAAQTRAAYAAIRNNGSLEDFSHLVWNDFCDKINETAQAAQDGWITSWGTLSETKMSTSSKVLTARRFNAAKNNIGSRVSTGISDVSPGDMVRGRYFITLAEKLNEWISQINTT